MGCGTPSFSFHPTMAHHFHAHLWFVDLPICCGSRTAPHVTHGPVSRLDGIQFSCAILLACFPCIVILQCFSCPTVGPQRRGTSMWCGSREKKLPLPTISSRWPALPSGVLRWNVQEGWQAEDPPYVKMARPVRPCSSLCDFKSSLCRLKKPRHGSIQMKRQRLGRYPAGHVPNTTSAPIESARETIRTNCSAAGVETML